jgi:hypothetical protein
MPKIQWAGGRTAPGRLCRVLLALALAACGPRAHIPHYPLDVPGALPPDDPVARRARELAPVLYLQRDETFTVERIVAVVHPVRRLIAYHLLWRDDVHGAWIPFTKPTDEEVVWVGYDTTAAPTDVWTYWHGAILHTDWRGKGTVAIDVQWGKHGSLPRGTNRADLPWSRKLRSFWITTIVGLPDIWLGRLSRPGPLCFCHGYRRYRDFDRRPLLVAPRLDAVVRAENPRPALRAVFGTPYSDKTLWP